MTVPSLNDQRSPEQRATHSVFVVGLDTFMSGWGRCENGSSLAAWACLPENTHAVMEWVEDRSDMTNVKFVTDLEEIDCTDALHLTIYAVGEDHPALRRAS